jgi:hypothetical protein
MPKKSDAKRTGAKKPGAAAATSPTASGAGTGAAARAEHWKREPEDHDFPAAADYLSLLLPTAAVTGVVARLRSLPVTVHKAKDLLRASGLAALPADNVHVAEDLHKVQRGERLSPVLLVRGRLAGATPLTVADGYHRICASYHLDEDADIPCRIADLASGVDM